MELIIVMVVTGIIALITPVLLFHGVKAIVFLPRAVTVNHAATEVMHQVIEGGYSILVGQTTIRGLRFAVKRSATEPALWLIEDDRVGFRTSDGQSVVIRWDSTTVNQEVIKRSLTAVACPPILGTEEVLPYYAQDPQSTLRVRIVRITPTTPVFQYYNQGGTPVGTPACSLSGITTVRRVDVSFIAQTGGGNFDQGDTQETVTSSVAIRVP